MPLTNQYLEAAFGPGFTGLATVGYALKDSTGADVVARTTSGVFEVAGGTYAVVAPAVADNVATVQWDTGGASPVYAHEDIGAVLRRVVEHVNADTGSISASAIADAVWNALLSSHSLGGSFGEAFAIVLAIARGGYEISTDGGGTLYAYDTDNSTVIATWELYDVASARTSNPAAVVRAVRV